MILLIYGILKKERKKRLMENRLDIARGSGQYFGAISKSARGGELGSWCPEQGDGSKGWS